ncbi:hypothetical protein NPX13_g5543 [Xylaria arbuscula]|uniref:Uncharacterized protein n=1 Tax=Xylaria arbuscula TaxID=114810 RepID=A0A9W8NEB1_9PEZI|nr:hypothetical protein NPX13_g5543 [Xylaria arbuscula]
MGLETGSLAGELWRNSGGQVDISVETILLTLAYISFALRIWSRSIQRAQYQLNDWLIVFVMFLTTIRYAVDVAVVVKCGLGLHIADVVAVGGPDILVLFSQGVASMISAHLRASLADSVEAPNALDEESRAIIHLWARVRFFFTVTNDVTFTLWQAGVLSAVVPLLGIISANLPIMQPALKTSFLLFKDLSTTRSTTRETSRKMLVGYDSRRFRQLPEDSICLATVEGEDLSATACLATH